MASRRQLVRILGTAFAGGVAGCLDSGTGTTGTRTDPGGAGPTDPPTTEASTSAGTGTSIPIEVPDSLPTPTQGNSAAAVAVDAYVDFECRYCFEYHRETYGKLKENYVTEGKIEYHHHDFPIVNEASDRIAQAARAVQYDADGDAFWAFSEEIFDANIYWGTDHLAELAGRVGADESYVERAVKRGSFEHVVDADFRESGEAGVSTTPTIRVNGTTTNWDYQSVSTIIDANL